MESKAAITGGLSVPSSSVTADPALPPPPPPEAAAPARASSSKMVTSRKVRPKRAKPVRWTSEQPSFSGFDSCL
jgi:hypothetical protein